MRPQMFTVGGQSTLFGPALTSGGEVDLRAEFDQLLFAPNGGTPHGRLFLIRRLRRDANSLPVPCTCLANRQTLEPDLRCKYCDGEGYLYSEHWITGYMRTGSSGGTVKDYKILYFRYDANLKFNDRIVLVALDVEGRPVRPTIRRTSLKLDNIAEMRSDHGRLEYYTCYCNNERPLHRDLVSAR